MNTDARSAGSGTGGCPTNTQALGQQGRAARHRREVEEFDVEPGELRALVTCINAETQRRMQPVEQAIESVRQALR